MKRLIFTILVSAACCSAAFAQRFQVGIRAGGNVADFKLPAITSADGVLRSDRNKVGFEASLAARLAVTKHLNLQAEFEYDRMNYGFKVVNHSHISRVGITSNRIELPVMLGLNFGPVRLFGGASFRLSHNEKSSVPSILRMQFDNSKVALTGGAGINIRRFFLEGRLTGYPSGSKVTAHIAGKDYRVAPKRDLKWSFSAGFLF